MTSNFITIKKFYLEHLTLYLGIHLDPKLTWKKHIDSSVDRCYSRSKPLKRSAGVTWGSTQDVMCTAYKCYVRHVVEYGNENIHTPNCQVFLQEFNPIMGQVMLESHLDLVWNVGKQFSIQDGSAEDAIKNAGAGAFSSAFSISYPVGKMKLIEFGKSRESIALQWTPSHCNISGNEKIDRLAKAGSLMSQPDIPLPLSNIKTHLQ
ncbi:hypothetical protein TNCV_2994131 [Trichonephila clavipes]|nr:hypothetical protein TNCV_2994131 [Trichonephila clavipes]